MLDSRGLLITDRIELAKVAHVKAIHVTDVMTTNQSLSVPRLHALGDLDHFSGLNVVGSDLIVLSSDLWHIY